MDLLEIVEIFWDFLQGEDQQAQCSQEQWEACYEQGIVDTRRVPKTRWQALLHQFLKQEGLYQIPRQALTQITPLLYQGPIHKPFDPFKIKEGLRPLSWLQEMYQKVLRFETTLSLAQWNQVINNKINKDFQIDKDYLFNDKFKDFIKVLIEEKASPLRKLELWVHGGILESKAPAGEKPISTQAAPAVLEDKFELNSNKLGKMRAVEKRYYDAGNSASTDDAETLKLLEELSQMEDGEEK